MMPVRRLSLRTVVTVLVVSIAVVSVTAAVYLRGEASALLANDVDRFETAMLVSPQTSYFSQDFSSSTVVSDYVSATPNSGQFNAIGSSGVDMILSINSGRLQFLRNGANAGSYSRTTDFSPTPSTMKFSVDLAVSGNAFGQTTAAIFQVGSGFGTANSAESNANTYGRFGVNWTTTDGQWSVREIGGGVSSSNVTGTRTLTWFLNNSGASLNYIAPDGSTESLANDTADLWIGTTRAFNDYAVTTPTQNLTDLKFAFTGGTAAIQLDNITVTDITPAAPVMATTPSSVAFGSRAVGTVGAGQNVRIDNTGTTSLNYSYAVTGDTDQFIVSGTTPGSVSPGLSTQIGVQFAPTSSGLKTATLTITGNDPANTTDTVTLTGTGVPAISGTVNVGAGQTYTNLTNNDGLFQALNNDLALTGDLTVNITSDLTNESGANALRNLTEQGAGAGTYRILIKPSGGTRTISGSIAGELIKLNGADRVTIDGWTGSAIGVVPDPLVVTRDLTITNTSTDPFASMVFFYNGLGNPSQSNTIQNVNIVGNSTSYTGIAFGGNGGGLGGGNDFNRALNNSVKSVRYGIYVQGQTAALPDISTQIVDNDLSGTGSDAIRQIGIVAVNQQNLQIRRNKVYVNRGGQPGGAIGIGLGADMDSKIAYNANTSGGIINAVVAQNRITGVVGSAQYGAHGIAVAGGSTGTNRLSNNMISGVIGAPSSPDLTTGVFIAGVAGSNTYLNYNSISMTGDRGSGAATPSYALAMGGSDPTVELKNNIFYTSQVATGGSGVSYSIGTAATTFANLNSNYNAFYHSGSFGYRVGGLLAGTQIADLSTWQSTVSDDANSQEADPLFIDPVANLHLQRTSPVIDDATNVGTTADIDGDARPLGAGYDIGADEVIPSPVMTTSQTSLAFGQQQIGTTSTAQSFTVSNTGTGTLNYNIGATGDVDQFVITGTLSGTIAPGGSTQIDVQFSPTPPLAAKSATLTISGDDPANGSDTVTLTGTANSVGAFTLSSSTYQANENAGVMQITVNRNNGTLGSVNATVTWGSGTAVGGTDPCVAGQDFIGTTTTLIFLQGDTTKSFNIPLCDDAVPEDSEVLSVSLSTNVGSVSPTGIAQATILDTDPRTRVVDILTDTDNGSLDDCTLAVDDDCSLRGAIYSANDGDTITFDPSLFAPPFGPEAAPAATITLTSAIGITTDVNIVGPGASLLTIDGAGMFRIFDIALGNMVSISGMTLTNADAGGGSDGGAIIQNPSSTLNLNAMVITDNLAATGGGIYTNSATLNVTNSTISSNETENEGGGIYNAESNVTITDSIISGNTARYNPQSLQLGGGGIYSGTLAGGSLTITGSTISNNCAGTRDAGNVCTTARSQGGGIAATAANISNTVISGNVAIDGAGIYHLRGLTLTNSTVSGNAATGSGGGISSSLSGGAFLTVIGSTFSANSAAVNGGGIYLNAADVSSIRNSTFSGNTAVTGGNLWIFPENVSSVTSSTFSGGTVHNESLGGFQLPVSNSIFAASCTGTDIVNTGFNIDSGTGCGFGSANNSMSSTDALLGPLQNNGGPTFTMAILPGSPAIDAGSAFGLTTDQRGMTRPIDHASVPNAGDGTDIGAFEIQAPTAAPASISGRVTTAHGIGIKGVTLSVRGMDGTVRLAYTNTLGYYRIDGLQVGNAFVVSVNARRYEFAAPTQVVNLLDSVAGLDFRALP